MSEETLRNDEVVEEAVEVQEAEIAEAVEEVMTAPVEEEPEAPKAQQKKGLAIASLVLGILSIVFIALFINYILGIIALILGIVYLIKKGEKKVPAIIGIVLASLSIIISSVAWYSIYRYITTTDINTMMEDIKVITGGEVDLQATLDETIKAYVGEDFEMEQLEAFVGGPLSIETVTNFVGDATEEEIQEFINTFDYAAIEADLGEGFTYEDLVAKLGEDFNFQDLKAYMDGLQ